MTSPEKTLQFYLQPEHGIPASDSCLAPNALLTHPAIFPISGNGNSILSVLPAPNLEVTSSLSRFSSYALRLIC